MYFCYFDETGDDGYPGSSKLFVLTSIYLEESSWKDVHKKTFEFRKKLKREFNLPIRMELHTKHFIANKKPYRKYFGVLPVEKKFILLSEYAEFISSLPLKAINTCINKNKLTSKNQIPVLELAMKFTIQRIENDLQANRNNFIIISDRGRLAAMRYVTRKLQAFNYVPSKFKKETYPNPIKLLLEDPMEKESTQSYFIQFSDFISFIVYHKLMKELSINEPSRKIEEFGHDKIDCLFQKVRSIFNLKACSDRREDGIFIYPK